MSPLKPIALTAAALCCSLAQAAWYPVAVNIWDPPYNDARQRRTHSYEALSNAAKPWKICASIPHLKDAYWMTVNFALIDEAKRLGVRLHIDEAGGYESLAVQRDQIEACMDSGADGLLVSGISSDGLSDLVAKYRSQGKPVIDLINTINPKDITARAAGSYWDNGHAAGLYLKQHAAQQSHIGGATVLWFPGPRGPGWTAAGDRGFKQALKDSDLRILETAWGDTGRATQAELINTALSKHGQVDYIVGTTVSTDAAVNILRQRELEHKTGVLAYYYGPGVHRNLKRGYIIAAPTDQQGLQARLAMDIVIRALEGKPFFRHVAPKVKVVDQQSIGQFDSSSSIPPRGFRPLFSVEDWVPHD